MSSFSVTPIDPIVETLFRAVRLFGLAVAPFAFAPEPPSNHGPTIIAPIAVMALGAIVVAAVRLRARLGTRPADAAAVLLVASVISALVCGAYFRGPNAPLGRGLLFVAAPLWTGLALVAYAVTRRRTSDKPASKSIAAALVVFAVGAASIGASFGAFRSADRMWWATLLRGGDTSRALDELLGKALRSRDFGAALGVLDRCVAEQPGSCLCLARRAELRTKTNDVASALVDAQSAASRCPKDPEVTAALVSALVANGDAAQGELAARRALASSDAAILHHALAMALDRQGRTTDALASARRAIELGAGRDAELLLGALLIRENDLEAAAKVLGALVSRSPSDADALYNLALIADKRDEYNRAREGYLAALRADPKLANARYNLALLTSRHGVVDEARHHARKFAELSPGDPRVADLMRRIEVTAAAKKP